MSIPIFTAQLKKARMATNQANARAAYAAATAQYLDEDETPTTNVYYEYTVDTALLGDQTADTATPKITTAIAEWDVDSTTYDGTTAVGAKTAAKWTVHLDKDGKLLGFTGAD